MIDTSIQTNVRSKPLLPLTTALGPVHIAVTDRQKALAIWQDVVGLDIVEELGNSLHMGAGGKVLIVLETGATRPVVPRTIGLYHVAIHVPARTDLAQMAVRALQRNVRISPTDHLVSEAIYLWDLDGNGIELTFETPWRGQVGSDAAGAYATTAEGQPHSGREPIDVKSLLAEIADNPEPGALPEGTRIGHVHVHVADLNDAMTFYKDVIGFGGQMLMPSWGMGDVHLNYMPHIIAFNIWSGRGAQPAPADAAGLRWYTIIVPDHTTLDEITARLDSASAGYTPVEGGIELTDPSQNRLRILLEPGD